MRRPRLFQFGGVGLGCVCLLVGCAQPRPFGDLWLPPRPYHAEVQATRPTSDSLSRGMLADDSSAASNPTGRLTLRDAVALTLRQSPALKAAGWGVAAAEADALQAGRPPNPRAALAVENFAGPDAGSTFERQTLRLSQVIELADKRAKRQALGEATQRLRAWDYEQARIDAAATAAERYVSVVVAQQRVALAEEQLALAQAGFSIADDRANNGTAPGLERDQAATRVALSRIALDQARQALAADRADLAAVWGATEPAFDEAAGDLEQRIELPTLDALTQRLDQSPRVARWADEIDQRQRAVALQKANAVADPSVGAGVRYFPDADDAGGVFEVSWPLTVFDDNRHGILAARLRVAQARTQQDQARTTAGQSLARAYARLQAASFALGSHDDEALPASRSAFNAARDAYQAGLTDYLTVLDAERTLLDIRNRRLDAAAAYHLALIKIEQITGQAIDH